MEFNIVLPKIIQNIQQIPSYYYIAIGSANYDQAIPQNPNKHELPDYVLEFNFPKKLLILIDPVTEEPLKYYNHTIIKIDNNTYKIDNLNIDIFVIRSNIDIDEHKDFLYNLIFNILNSHQNSLISVSIYTGISMHDKQDIIINMFEPEYQLKVRSRFLLDCTYYKDVSCRYDITNPMYQPIIEENGKFYNPGFLLLNEFDEELKKIYDKTDIISLQKKSFLNALFEIYIKKYLNQTYFTYRQQHNNTLDISEKKYYRERMLECVYNLLQCIKSFLDIEIIIDRLRTNNIYNDENEIRSIINLYC